MNEISVINANTALSVASEMVKDLNAIASAIGTKSLEYSWTLAVNAAPSSAFVKEMTESGYCTQEKYNTAMFAAYCEEKLNMSKSAVYDYVRIGEQVRKAGKSFEFILWENAKCNPVYEIGIDGKPFIARYEESPTFDKYKGKSFTPSAIGVILRIKDKDTIIELMRQEKITPCTTVSELREIAKEYKDAKTDGGRIVYTGKVEKPKKEKPEKPMVEFDWKVTDSITKHIRIPADILKKYIVEDDNTEEGNTEV